MKLLTPREQRDILNEVLSLLEDRKSGEAANALHHALRLTSRPPAGAVCRDPLVAHAMVDFETLGTEANALPLSLGVVLMDANFNPIGEREWYLDWEYSKDAMQHFSITYSTFLWWLKQGSEAQHAITDAPKVQLGAVVQQFVEMLPMGSSWDNVCIWGNGAGFDNPILKTMFNATGREPPYKFWNERCFRTVKALYNAPKQDESHGPLHKALADAQRQAAVLKAILG